MREVRRAGVSFFDGDEILRIRQKLALGLHYAPLCRQYIMGIERPSLCAQFALYDDISS